MFITAPEPSKESNVLLRAVSRKLGDIPPHFTLLAGISPVRFRMFLDEIAYITEHPHIRADFFVFLRRVIAEKNGFGYCRDFNERILHTRGYSAEQIVQASEGNLPFDRAHNALFRTALAAMDDPATFKTETIDALKEHGWSEADIYDALDHGAFMFKFAKLIKAYSR